MMTGTLSGGAIWIFVSLRQCSEFPLTYGRELIDVEVMVG
jgi:hypothetical protein